MKKGDLARNVPNFKKLIGIINMFMLKELENQIKFDRKYNFMQLSQEQIKSLNTSSIAMK